MMKRVFLGLLVICTRNSFLGAYDVFAKKNLWSLVGAGCDYMSDNALKKDSSFIYVHKKTGLFLDARKIVLALVSSFCKKRDDHKTLVNQYLLPYGSSFLLLVSCRKDESFSFDIIKSKAIKIIKEELPNKLVASALEKTGTYLIKK